MKNWIFMSLMVWALVGSAGIAAAQSDYETENVAKYRKVYGFKLPDVVAANPGEETVGEVLMISPDSFGVNYTYDYVLDQMVDMHKKLNFDKDKGPGFRIQIYAGSKLEHANEAKSDFIESFSDFEIEVYQKWQPPHFRVRVGDFLSKGEAMREMAMIRQVFPDAFVVRDEIFLPKFKNRVPGNLESVGNDEERMGQN
ncbi:MAG: SPOR domain-containing protein [Bacteroidota bacterium]